MINSPARKNVVRESSIVRAMNDTVLETLNIWGAAQDTDELSFRFKALPPPIPNKTYYLNYPAILEQYLTVIRGTPALILSFDEELFPSIAHLATPDMKYRGDAVNPIALKGSLFVPIDTKKTPSKNEVSLFTQDDTFSKIKKHLEEKGYAATTASQFIARKRLSVPKTTKYFENFPVGSTSVLCNGILLPFTNADHETVAYEFIYDKFVNSDSGEPCERSSDATYVGSVREIYTEQKNLHGAYCLLGSKYDCDLKEIWVVESYATGASLLEMNPSACVMVYGLSSNLSACVETLFKQHAKGEFKGLEHIVIFANNDIYDYYHTLNSEKAEHAANAGIYAALETHEVYRNNSAGVSIAICAIPDAVALAYSVNDFDSFRQYLSLTDRQMSTSWREYEIDTVAYLENPKSFCTKETVFKSKVSTKKKESTLSKSAYLDLLNKKFSEVATRVDTVYERCEERLSNEVGDLLFNSTGSIYLQSAMGTGKTYQIIRMIKKVCASGENVLYLIPSLSLSKDLVRTLTENGLNVVDYKNLEKEKEKGGNFHKPHVAVCVINSAAKFVSGNYSTIVMDESDQCLHNVIQLVSSPFDFTKGFSAMLNKAERVVACYAQLSTISTDYLDALRNEKGILVLNNFKPSTDKTVHMMPTAVSAYKIIKDLLHQEKKLLILSNSVRETTRIKQFIDEFYLGVSVFVLSNEENQQLVNEFISDINTQVTGYDVVVASPKLSSGVSIDVDHFDAIVGIYLPANDRMGSVLSNVQQLGRARAVKDIYLFTAARTNYALPTDIVELANSQKKHTQAYMPAFSIANKGIVVSDVHTYEAYASLHFGSVAMRNLLDQNQRACTEFLLEQQGYQVETLTKKDTERFLSSSEEKEIKELCASIKERVKEDESRFLLHCEPLSLKTYLKLSKSLCATAEDKLRCKRFAIEAFIGQKALPEDIALWGESFVNKIHWLELLNMTEVQVKAKDLSFFESARTKNKLIDFLSLSARKKFLTILHSVYFEKDGTPVQEVSRHSPRVAKAIAQLTKLSESVELCRFSNSLTLWKKNPMLYFNNEMKKMGFLFTVSRKSVKGEIIRFYSCQIDPVLLPYLEQRKYAHESGTPLTAEYVRKQTQRNTTPQANWETENMNAAHEIERTPTPQETVGVDEDDNDPYIGQGDDNEMFIIDYVAFGKGVIRPLKKEKVSQKSKPSPEYYFPQNREQHLETREHICSELVKDKNKVRGVYSV